MEKKFHGIIPPLVTPVDEKENVDEGSYRNLIEHCIQGGVHGVMPVGTNGETMALTQRERLRAIQITIDQVGGRVPVVAGCMDTSTRRVIENIKAAQDVGLTCAAVTPIFYDRHTSQEETVRHFERILQETDIPELIIYNIPPFTGLKLSAQTIIKIGNMDERVVGCKDSSGDFSGFLDVMEAFEGKNFSTLSGVTTQGLSSVLLGATGMVPALAPCFPALFKDAFEAAKSGNVELTWKYNKVIRESSRILGMSKNGTAAAKCAIASRGLIHKRVIWPQDFIASPEEEAAIVRKVAEVDELYAALKTELDER